MSTTKPAYTVTGSLIGITLASLAAAGYRESAGVSNAINLYMDALVGGSIQVGAVGATVGQSINIYAYASSDGGTVYSGGLAGVDETIMWGTTPASSSVVGYLNLVRLGSAAVDPTNDANNDIEFGPFSVADAFGGVLPADWGIVIENNTDAALHATGTNNVLHFSGVNFSNV